jgi:hypothetical protein
MNHTTNIMQEQEVNLIKGMFDASDAAEVVLTMLRNKIKFHQNHIYSFKETGLGDIDYSQKRIQELQAAKNDVTDFLVQAKKENRKVAINGTINLSIK